MSDYQATFEDPEYNQSQTSLSDVENDSEGVTGVTSDIDSRYVHGIMSRVAMSKRLIPIHPADCEHCIPGVGPCFDHYSLGATF